MFLCSVQYDFCGELDAAGTTTSREIEKYIKGNKRQGGEGVIRVVCSPQYLSQEVWLDGIDPTHACIDCSKLCKTCFFSAEGQCGSLHLQ
jgi:hypothetical protein